MNWDHCSGAFDSDGSLRDICVHDMGPPDWARFFSFVSKCEPTFFRDGMRVAPPDQISEFFPENPKHALMMQIARNGVTFNFQKFVENELEMDIDPKEINSQQELDVVVDFLRSIGTALNKMVTLTDENSPEVVWIEYDPTADQLKFKPN